MDKSGVIPVKLVAAVLAGSDPRFRLARFQLADILGPVDYESAPFPFSHTDYYNDEMGPGLARRILSFEALIDPADIVRIKKLAMDMERKLSVNGKRTVNIDPGYLDYYKLVLASTKPGGPKVYLGSGIWADITLFYSKGKFHPPDWAFPDFKTVAYNTTFLEIRMRYKRGTRREEDDPA